MNSPIDNLSLPTPEFIERNNEGLDRAFAEMAGFTIIPEIVYSMEGEYRFPDDEIRIINPKNFELKK